MQRDRGAEIRKRQEENKKLEEDTKKMEEQLERIKKLKQKQQEKLILQKQLQDLQKAVEKQKDIKAEQKEIKRVDRLKKAINFGMQSSSSQSEDKDGENVRYFLEVMGMKQYFQSFLQHKIVTLQKLRSNKFLKKDVKEPQLKEMNIPLKDQVKIIKKLRSMGY